MPHETLSAAPPAAKRPVTERTFATHDGHDGAEIF